MFLPEQDDLLQQRLSDMSLELFHRCSSRILLQDLERKYLKYMLIIIQSAIPSQATLLKVWSPKSNLLKISLAQSTGNNNLTSLGRFQKYRRWHIELGWTICSLTFTFNVLIVLGLVWLILTLIFHFFLAPPFCSSIWEPNLKEINISPWIIIKICIIKSFLL